MKLDEHYITLAAVIPQYCQMALKPNHSFTHSGSNLSIYTLVMTLTIPTESGLVFARRAVLHTAIHRVTGGRTVGAIWTNRKRQEYSAMVSTNVM